MKLERKQSSAKARARQGSSNTGRVTGSASHAGGSVGCVNGRVAHCTRRGLRLRVRQGVAAAERRDVDASCKSVASYVTQVNGRETSSFAPVGRRSACRVASVRARNDRCFGSRRSVHTGMHLLAQPLMHLVCNPYPLTQRTTHTM